jgi:FMN phosphatase YigB (HAD superfamily)
MSALRFARDFLTMASVSRHRVKLVCFDLGGVLLRICRTWSEACVAAGLDVRAEIDPRINGDDWAHLNRLYQTGRMEGDEFAAKISALINGVYSAREIGLIHDAWIIGEYEGAAHLVDDLHLAGLHTAALSNTCREHWLFMPRFEVIRKIRYRLGSHLLGVCKPDAAAYAQIERRTGCSGRDIVFFDDLPRNVEAAAERGWHAHLVDPAAGTVSQMRAALSAYLTLPGGGVRG